MAIVKNRIVKKYLILCEGLDAANFLIAYLNSDTLMYDNRFRNVVQVMDFKGNEQLSNYISNLKKFDGYTDVASILVLRDSEKNVRSAEDAVKSAFRKNDLPVPSCSNQWERSDMPNTAYTLFPTCDTNLTSGTLEDLCWSILADKNADEYRKDVQTFIKFVNQKYDSLTRFEHKGRLHTYFSVKDDFVTLKIGEAANAGAFDWSHQALEPLKKLIVAGWDG